MKRLDTKTPKLTEPTRNVTSHQALADEINQAAQRILTTESISALEKKGSDFDVSTYLMTTIDTMQNLAKQHQLCLCFRHVVCECLAECNCDHDQFTNITRVKFEFQSGCRCSVELSFSEPVSRLEYEMFAHSRSITTKYPILRLFSIDDTNQAETPILDIQPYELAWRAYPFAKQRRDKKPARAGNDKADANADAMRAKQNNDTKLSLRPKSTSDIDELDISFGKATFYDKLVFVKDAPITDISHTSFSMSDVTLLDHGAQTCHIAFDYMSFQQGE